MICGKAPDVPSAPWPDSEAGEAPPLVFAAMPSEKRQRQDEGRLLRLEEQRAATQKVQRKRQLRTLGLIIGAVIVVARWHRHLQRRRRRRRRAPATRRPPPTPRRDAATVVLPGAGAAITGETPCPPADGSAERTTSFEQAPPMCIDPAKTYTATLDDHRGRHRHRARRRQRAGDASTTSWSCPATTSTTTCRSTGSSPAS